MSPLPLLSNTDKALLCRLMVSNRHDDFGLQDSNKMGHRSLQPWPKYVHVIGIGHSYLRRVPWIVAYPTIDTKVDGRTLAPPKKPWNGDSLVNTNKQWCSMVSKVVKDFVHPRYN